MILKQAEQFAFLRFAGPMFDWRAAPHYETPGLTADHHTAPLENGDRLHVYRQNTEPDNPFAQVMPQKWIHEIEPHDMPSRFPLKWRTNLPQDAKPGAHIMGRDPDIDPTAQQNSRRNLSLRSRLHPDGTYENGRAFTNPQDAMEAVEQRYLREAPKWKRNEHSSELADTPLPSQSKPYSDDDFDYFTGPNAFGGLNA